MDSSKLGRLYPDVMARSMNGQHGPGVNCPGAENCLAESWGPVVVKIHPFAVSMLAVVAAALTQFPAVAQDSASIGVLPPSDVATPPTDAPVTPSGIAFVVLAQGSGKVRPGLNDLVTVHYTGWTTGGQTIGTTVGRQPRTLPLRDGLAGCGLGC